MHMNITSVLRRTSRPTPPIVKSDRGEHQVVGGRDVHDAAPDHAERPSAGCTASHRARRGRTGRWPLRRASATPPTTAITSSTAVISNAHTKSVNRPPRASRRCRSRVRSSAPDVRVRAGGPVVAGEEHDHLHEQQRAEHDRDRALERLGSSKVSCWSTPSSVITNTNSTTIALAYTTIWMAATSVGVLLQEQAPRRSRASAAGTAPSAPGCARGRRRARRR